MGRQRGLPLVAVYFIALISQADWAWGEDPPLNYITHKGELCRSSCGTQGYSYNWCYTRSGSGYCSILQNRDYKGKPCLDSHPCGLHGQDYYWCYKNEGGWDYCGKVEPKTFLYMSSTYQAVCIDDCLFDSTENYFWCYTEKGWDYCSPLRDVTYKNKPCSSGYTCDTHGYDYTWCWTGFSSSEKCGVIKAAECQYNQAKRKKRQPNNTQLVCTVKSKAHKKETRFQAVPDADAFADRGNYGNELQNIISRWTNDRLSNQARSNLITSEHLRIDMQGMVNHNNQRYYNLQVQINGPRRPGTSTTLAQALIPQNDDIPDRYVRRALTESAQRQARIFITVSYSCLTTGQSCSRQ